MSVSRTRFNFCLVATLLLGAFGLGGCQTVGYYAQAVNGQLAVWRAAEPIDRVLESEETEPALRERLVLVSEIRDFASAELSLPDNDSYRRYADLGRPYVVWNVFAAPEFSLSPVRWCFPVAGCVSYRGYFSREDAEKYADYLRVKGSNGEKVDVFFGGVSAYSTLGWFADPVLNTFIGYADAQLARLIFHELAHQVAYAKGDTTFNESFATTVELEGVRRWLEANGRSDQFDAFLAARRRQEQFLALVIPFRDELKVLYEEDISDEEKRSRKVGTYARLREAYAELKEDWGGYSGYDGWFDNSLNNARMASVAAYNQLGPGVQDLLARNDGDLESFYEAVSALTELDYDERRDQLGFNSETGSLAY